MKDKCCVCSSAENVIGKPSSLGPWSDDYCESCAQKGLEPYIDILQRAKAARFFFVGQDEWSKTHDMELVYNTLIFFNKTFYEFCQDVVSVDLPANASSCRKGLKD